jgi:hypothetical protein
MESLLASRRLSSMRAKDTTLCRLHELQITGTKIVSIQALLVFERYRESRRDAQRICEPRGMLVAALSHEPMGEQAGSLIVRLASQKLDFCASPGD